MCRIEARLKFPVGGERSTIYKGVRQGSRPVEAVREGPFNEKKKMSEVTHQRKIRGKTRKSIEKEVQASGKRADKEMVRSFAIVGW